MLFQNLLGKISEMVYLISDDLPKVIGQYAVFDLRNRPRIHAVDIVKLI